MQKQTDKLDIPDFSSVEELEKLGLKMYPSPVNDKLFVEWSNEVQSQTRVTIYTVDGQNVAMFTNNLSAFSVDLTNIVAGLYVIEIQSDELTVSSTFDKELIKGEILSARGWKHPRVFFMLHF